MIGRALLRTSQITTSRRYASGFNKSPTLKVQPFDISGNALLIGGATFMLLSTTVLQLKGYLMPRELGVRGLRGIQKMPMDLTPDELLEKQRN